MQIKSRLNLSSCIFKAFIGTTLASSIFGCTQIPISPETTSAIGSVVSSGHPAFKYIKTHLLEIAYLDYGPADGETILLYHGWPDSPLAWKHVAPELAKHGYRVLVPTLRGFGDTRFLSDKTQRSGQATALAQDVIDFADALKIDRFTLVGHDWGAGFTYQVAANWPTRVKNLVPTCINQSNVS